MTDDRGNNPREHSPGGDPSADRPGIPVFTAAALSLLDGQTYDPAARGRYELFSGGLFWSDEFPRGSSELWRDWVHRF